MTPLFSTLILMATPAHAFVLAGLFSAGLVGMGLLIAVVAAVIADQNILTREARRGSQSFPGYAESAPAATLIIGAGAVGRSLAANLEAKGSHRIVGFIDDDVRDENCDGWPVLGRRDQTAEVVRRFGVDEVIVAYAPTWQQDLMEELMDRPQVRIRAVPTPYEIMMATDRLESLGDIALVQVTSERQRIHRQMKRLLDICLSVAGLVVLGPVMAAVAVLVKMTSKGPVIFAQERTGIHGSTFTLYKFRTMVVDAEKDGPQLSTGKLDARLTSIGRFLKLCRLDEVPQLWNVLRGEMSMVGPRPERPVFVERFAEQWPTYMHRHQVVPGITGLAQVCGGYHTDARDKLRFDLIYIARQSVWLDLVILARTVLVVFRTDRH